MNLPLELLQEVACSLFALDKDHTDHFWKPRWGDVAGLSETSKFLRSIVMKAWFRVLRIHDPSDWKIIAVAGPFIYQQAEYVLCE